MALMDHVARELGLQSYRVRREVAVTPDLRLDGVLDTEDVAYLIEVKSRLPKTPDLALLVLARELWSSAGRSPAAVPVLVVPGAGARVRRLAAEAGVEIVQVPASLLPLDAERIGETPLTTEQSWAVVCALLRVERAASVRDLAKRASVSTGWTYQVVGELEARGALVRRGGGLELVEPVTVLDAVASERPLKELEVKRLPTGLDEPEDLALTMVLGAQEVDPAEGRVGLYACGTTAAAHYTGYMVQRDRFDVYSGVPGWLERLFDGRSGGIVLHVHEPDRAIRARSGFVGDMMMVSQEQALLDVAGTGMAFRDLTLQLLEVLGR